MDDPRAKPPCYRDDAVAVVKILRDAGHSAYFAGGCVRDVLLGLTPKDYDVATDAVPQRVRSLFHNTQAVGQAFGVILVPVGRSVVEVATFRSDGEYHDGRRPSEVRFTTAAEDAQRRDFTINGLFLDPASGQVIDHVGGQADLANKVLRAIGDADARFEEDHLRLLRAIRFAARFSFEIDPATATAIGHHAPQLVRISPERTAEELRTMLTPATRMLAFQKLADFKLLEVIFRFAGRPVAAKPELLGAIAPGRSIRFGFALAAATMSSLMDADDRSFFSKASVQRLAQAVRQALRPSNDELDDFQGALDGVRVLLHEGPLTLARKKRFLARPTARFSRELAGALQADGWRGLEATLEELEKTEFAPTPLVTGDDLTAAGLKPGPVFKRVLDAVYDAQLEDRVSSKEDAMRLALALASA